MRKKVKNFPWSKVFLTVSLLSALVGVLASTKTLAQTDRKIAEAKEMARPANVKLTKISTPNCKECFNIDEAMATFKKQNVAIGAQKTLYFNSSEAQTLISQLGITRLPTYIATGEVNKKNLEGFVKNNGIIRNNTFVFTKVTPLFIDPLSQKEIGKVRVTYLTDPACTTCINPKLTIAAYKRGGIKITEEKDILWNSAEGQRIVNQYKIAKLPTFLLSSDISYYPDLAGQWSNFGTVEQDKTYVARRLFPPYRDVAKNQVVGLVETIYLTDISCADCYNPQQIHKNILTRGFGVGIRSEQTADINTPAGKELISKYKITQVPTLLISPEVSEYANIKSVWPQVGTTEPDGWYVFRQISKLGNVTYKDLASNQIRRPVVPKQSTANP